MPQDTNLIMAAAAAVEADANGTTKDFGGPDVQARTYLLNCTLVSGTNPSLDVEIEESDDDSTWRNFLTFKRITAAGQQYVTGRSNARYRRAVFDIGGTNTPSFTCSVEVVAAGRYQQF